MAKSSSKAKPASATQRTLSLVRDGIQRAAREHSIKPSAVTAVQFWSAAREVTEWDVRKLGGFARLKREFFPFRPDEDAVSAFWLGNEAKDDNKHLRTAMRDEAFFRSLEKFADRVFTGKVKAQPPKLRSSKTKRIISAVFSDLHFGSNIRREETTHEYGRIEESRRLARVVREVANYKIQYREQTELELLLLGDIIQNQLHSPTDGAPLAEQVARAIHLLVQAIGYLSTRFKKVRVRCSTGNHGRNTARHKERAVDQKWDSIETIVYYAVKKACSELKNVEFFIPKTPWGEYEVFGRKVFYAHGDTVLKPGNPGKSIDTGGLENQTNRINAALPDKDEFSVFVCGHVHTASATFLGNGAVMLTNGALCPVDQFANSIGLLESAGGQFVFESVEGFPFGDSRLIRVNSETDKDESLDEIIAPWESFD